MGRLVLACVLAAVLGTTASAQAQPPSPPIAIMPDTRLPDRVISEQACFPVTGVAGEPSPAPLWWGSAELLYWWFDGMSVPPLVTQGPGTGAAVIGQPGTTTLVGSSLDGLPRVGGRFSVGRSINVEQSLGLEGSYFFLGTRAADRLFFATGAPHGPTLARPFINATTGLEDSELIASPNTLAGSVLITSRGRMQGADGLLVNQLIDNCWLRVEGLAGFRYVELIESLGVTEDLLGLSGSPAIQGTSFLVQDKFRTRNQFYGGVLGFRAQTNTGRAGLYCTTKLAVGNTYQSVNREGATRFVLADGAASARTGGLLVLPTNVGVRSIDQIAFVPEVGIGLGLQLFEGCRATLGYSFLYWSDVARPGALIDRTVNPTQLPQSTGPGQLVGPARPTAIWRDTDFWAQGIQIGLEVNY